MNAEDLRKPIAPVRRKSNIKVGFFWRMLFYAELFLDGLVELLRSARLYGFDVAIVAGNERYSGHHLRVLYIGNFDSFAFVFSRMYSKFDIIERCRNIKTLGISSWTKRYRGTVDLVVIDAGLLIFKILPREKYIKIPQWVKQRFKVPDTWESVLKSFRKSTKKEMRRILKYGFTYKITTLEDDINFFYHQMYMPYIKRIYGDEAIIVPEKRFLEKSHNAQLIQLLRNEKVVLASLLSDKGRLSIEWVGGPDNIEPEMLKGASDALDYFIIRYGYENGNHTIDFGPSRPLLNDGVFQYKRKWGTYVENGRMPMGDILLRPLKFNIPVVNFFSHHHFITRNGRKLVGRILFNDRQLNARDLEYIEKRYYSQRLDHIKIFALLGLEDGVIKSATKHSKKLRIFDLSNCFHPEEDFCRS
ncbi:MAG: hypothetical protein JSW07_01045 [bacterium]|nr:MAG: hypothetical protein JSW07_01045 [bacterium]